MAKLISDILEQNNFSRQDIIQLLNANAEDTKNIFRKAKDIKRKYIGNKVYFRGLIEFSNICSKDCLYCGIRKSNQNVERYNISDENILRAAKFAYENDYGSIVIQGGELRNKAFVNRIDNLLKEIKRITNNKIGITLSLGEQSEETYKRWFDSGAHRYLLRIEASNKELYYKIHPNTDIHSFDERIKCLSRLSRVGYQTGTGVMIGLPFQTTEDLADDLLFFKSMDIDMIGMGPYIEHKDTPLYAYKDFLMPLKERFTLSLKMIAILRIMQKDINIAAATALQAIDPIGREKAIEIGANIIMPNITPPSYRANYRLYENKPCIDENEEDCVNCIEMRIKLINGEIGYGKWGDSKHYFKRHLKEELH